MAQGKPPQDAALSDVEQLAPIWDLAQILPAPERAPRRATSNHAEPGQAGLRHLGLLVQALGFCHLCLGVTTFGVGLNNPKRNREIEG